MKGPSFSKKETFIVLWSQWETWNTKLKIIVVTLNVPRDFHFCFVYNFVTSQSYGAKLWSFFSTCMNSTWIKELAGENPQFLRKPHINAKVSCEIVYLINISNREWNYMYFISIDSSLKALSNPVKIEKALPLLPRWWEAFVFLWRYQ